jgi:hypothetical protein
MTLTDTLKFRFIAERKREFRTPLFTLFAGITSAMSMAVIPLVDSLLLQALSYAYITMAVFTLMRMAVDEE